MTPFAGTAFLVVPIGTTATELHREAPGFLRKSRIPPTGRLYPVIALPAARNGILRRESRRSRSLRRCTHHRVPPRREPPDADREKTGKVSRIFALAIGVLEVPGERGKHGKAGGTRRLGRTRTLPVSPTAGSVGAGTSDAAHSGGERSSLTWGETRANRGCLIRRLASRVRRASGPDGRTNRHRSRSWGD
jgi:hypothetical protein